MSKLSTNPNAPATVNEVEANLNNENIDNASDLIKQINEINNNFNNLDVNNESDISNLINKCDNFNKNSKQEHLQDIKFDDTNKILFFYCSMLLKCLNLIVNYNKLKGKENYKTIITSIITQLLELIADYQKINKDESALKLIVKLLDQTDIHKTIFYFIVLTKKNIEEFVPSVVDIPKRTEMEFPHSQQLRATTINKKNGKKIQIPIKSYINSTPNSNPTLNPGLNQLVNSTSSRGTSKSKKMTIRTKFYSCPPTLLETVIPEGYTSKTSITIKGNNKYYKVGIPKGSKAGTKLFIEQPTVGILNVGQTPPYCNVEDKILVIEYYKLVDSKIDLPSGSKYSSSGFKFNGLKKVKNMNGSISVKANISAEDPVKINSNIAKPNPTPETAKPNVTPETAKPNARAKTAKLNATAKPGIFEKTLGRLPTGNVGKRISSVRKGISILIPSPGNFGRGLSSAASGLGTAVVSSVFR